MTSNRSKSVTLLYGQDGMQLQVPASAAILEGQEIPPLPDPDAAVVDALEHPVGSASLRELVRARQPKTVAITISDITRPVPNKIFLPPMLRVLNACGIADSQIVIIIGTGMHRASTQDERRTLVGDEILNRFEVIDHNAHDPSTLVKVSDDPPVSVCRRFAQADFRIVTGYIEAHFMAGFSGGRKGVCPALVDLKTVQRFHGYQTLADPNADTGKLDGNPCHEISLRIAKIVGVDFLFNVAITRDRRMAGIFCGDLVAAHRAGCSQVAKWTTAKIEKPFDLVVTCGGGYPLDQTLYQTVKGMCAAMPALYEGSTMLVASHCGEKLGSQAYTDMILKWDNNWRGFLEHIKANKDKTDLDQWEFQMRCRVLERIGLKKLWFVCDGIDPETQKHITVTPILGPGDAQTRAQRAIDGYIAKYPSASVAIIPDGPYTMLS